MTRNGQNVFLEGQAWVLKHGAMSLGVLAGILILIVGGIKMSFNPKNGAISTLCPHCGAWNDWNRKHYITPGTDVPRGKKWHTPIICSNCNRELRHPDDPVRRHYLAAHHEKQSKLTGGKK